MILVPSRDITKKATNKELIELKTVRDAKDKRTQLRRRRLS